MFISIHPAKRPSKKMKDYYAVLGVAPRSGSDVVEIAYRNLLSGAALTPSRRDEIEQAYKVLSDPAARQIYDQAFGAAAGAPAKFPAVETGLLEALSSRALNMIQTNRRIGALIVAVVVLPIIASMLITSRMDKEREQLRLQREREIQVRAQEANAEQQQREAERAAARDEEQQRQEADKVERQNRYEAERALRRAEHWRRDQVEDELAERRRKADEKARAVEEEKELRRQNEAQAKQRLEEYRSIIRSGSSDER